MSKEMNDTDRGGLRLLTIGEMHLTQTLYGYSIRYNEVWIHRGSYFPFNMQFNAYAMTPNGEMYFQEGVYYPDYSQPMYRLDRVSGQHLFLHEMMHVWQHQRRMMAWTLGIFSRVVDGNYELNKTHLSYYGIENQACIVSDYCLLKTYGFDNRSNLYRLKIL